MEASFAPIWIAELASASGGAPTLAAAARAVAPVLAEGLSLLELTLVRRGAKQERVEFASARLVGGQWLAETRRERLSADLGRAAEAGRPVSVTQPECPAVTVWVLPAGAELALLRLEGARRSLEFDDALGLALARALEVGASARERLARVARLSREAHREGARLRADLEARDHGPELVATSEAMRTLLRKLGAAAQTPITLLLLGESGTGKSALARWAHANSRRAGGPLVTVDCGALPEALIESELFGHAAGAFTGARGRREGRIARARGGTVFLDEVGELPLSAQAKLLRVLQEGEVEPIGGSGPVSVDVRFMAATNRPLETLVREGEFREDLYYRLSMFQLEVPPLRARGQDLPALCAFLLARGCERLGLPRLRLRRRDLAPLMERAWPGNIRQLQSVLEASAVLSRGPWLELDPEALSRGVVLESVAPAPVGSSPQTFAALVRQALVEALRASGGKIYGPGGAAERLDLHPSTLQTKLKKHGIDRREFVD